MIEFSKDGTRIYTGKDKGEAKFRFQAGHDTEQELKELDIEIESEIKDVHI
jgi:hypothetical protein